MDYKEFFAQVKAGSLRGAYLFEGTEEYVKASALAAVEKAMLPPGMEQLNEAVLDNPATDALIAAAETLPFLADKRLVVARELSAFTGRGEGDDRLGEYLARIPESCVLILYVQGKADARKKLYQAVKKHGTVVSFQPMDEAELNRWLARTAKGMGKGAVPGGRRLSGLSGGERRGDPQNRAGKACRPHRGAGGDHPGRTWTPSAPGPWSARCSRWWTRWWRAQEGPGLSR